MTHVEVRSKLGELEELIKSDKDYHIAETQARELLHIINVLPTREDSVGVKVRTLIALSASLWLRGMAREALLPAEEALSLAEQVHHKELQAKALGNIGSVYMYLSDYTIALEYYTRALALEEFGNKSNIAKITSNIGSVYFYLSDYSKALEYYLRTLSLNEELGNKSGIANISGNIGNVYVNLSNYPKALEYHSRALALDKELGNKIGIARHTGNIGGVYYSLSDYTKALEYYSRALMLNEELNNKNGIANNTGNIGNVYVTLSDYTQALEHLHKALNLSRELENKRQEGYWCESIGNILLKQGLLQESKEYMLMALRLRRDIIKSDEHVAVTLLFISEVLYKENTIEESVATAIEALELAEKYGEMATQYKAHHILSKIYAHTGNYVHAFEHHKKYHELYLEVQSEEATNQARLIEHRRKIEESERDRQIMLARFQEQEKILYKTLPPAIADRLINGEKDIADRYDAVSILFADIVGFTPLSACLSPREVVQMLNNLFSRFDKLTEKFGVERIKTIGDAYMVVAGAPEVVADHAVRLAKTAFGMLDEVADFNANTGHSIKLRIGLNSGEAIAAVVGDVKFSYDLWSDAVNTASRMESHGEAGKIHVTEEFKHAVETLHATSLHATSLRFIERGEMDIKGKGLMRTYFLERYTE